MAPRSRTRTRLRLCRRPLTSAGIERLAIESSWLRAAGAGLDRVLAAGHGELVLRMPDALLELPAVGVRLPPLHQLQLALRRLELLARAHVVDLLRRDGVVNQRDRAVELHLEESRAGRVL